MTTPRRLLQPLLAALALAALALAVSACGYESHEKDVVEGEPVEVGDLHYNVIFSRYLNPNDTEDSAYLLGQAPPAPETTYFGVFFEVQNENDEAQPLPESFTIRDADHNKFESLPSESLYALPLGVEVADRRGPEAEGRDLEVRFAEGDLSHGRILGREGGRRSSVRQAVPASR